MESGLRRTTKAQGTRWREWQAGWRLITDETGLPVRQCSKRERIFTKPNRKLKQTHACPCWYGRHKPNCSKRGPVCRFLYGWPVWPVWPRRGPIRRPRNFTEFQPDLLPKGKRKRGSCQEQNRTRLYQQIAPDFTQTPIFMRSTRVLASRGPPIIKKHASYAMSALQQKLSSRP